MSIPILEQIELSEATAPRRSDLDCVGLANDVSDMSERDSRIEGENMIAGWLADWPGQEVGSKKTEE